MDFRQLFILLIILFLSVTGAFYWLVYKPGQDEIVPPEAFGSFQENFTSMVNQHVSPQYRSTIQSMTEFRV